MRNIIVVLFLLNLSLVPICANEMEDLDSYVGNWLLVRVVGSNYIDKSGDYLKIRRVNDEYLFEFLYSQDYRTVGDKIQKGRIIAKENYYYLECTDGFVYKVNKVSSIFAYDDDAISVSLDDFWLGYFQKEEILKNLP